MIDFSEINQKITATGYCTMSAVDPAMPERLLQFYLANHPNKLEGFHPTLMQRDAGKRKLLSDFICSELQDYVEKHIPSFRLLYGSFMVKEPGEQSNMKLHQDWSYVSEPGQESLAIWFPLTDLNEQNGALHVIPRSHLIENYVRGPGVFCPFSENSDYIIKEWGLPLFLKKGEPVIWNHRLLHYSPPNLSAEPRVAVTAILVSEGSTVIHYFKPEENDVVQEYEVEKDFYFHYEIGQMPQKNVILRRQFEHRQPTYSKDFLRKALDNPTNGWRFWDLFKGKKQKGNEGNIT